MSASMTTPGSPSPKVMLTERKECGIAFLKAAIAQYHHLGVRHRRVMTDTGTSRAAKATFSNRYAKSV